MYEGQLAALEARLQQGTADLEAMLVEELPHLEELRVKALFASAERLAWLKTVGRSNMTHRALPKAFRDQVRCCPPSD